MKKNVLLAFLLLVITKSFASEFAGGLIIWENGSRTGATFIIPFDSKYNDMSLQEVENQIEYFDTDFNNTKFLKPEQVREIRFLFRNDSVRMVSCLNPPEPDRPASFVFLRILIDGRIKLFCNYSKRTTYSGGGPTIPDVSIPIPGSADIVFPGSSPAPYIKGYKIISKPIIQDSTGAFVKINELNFKRKMKSYADDCKELRYKINTEKYTFSDLYTVVKEYNECIR